MIGLFFCPMIIVLTNHFEIFMTKMHWNIRLTLKCFSWIALAWNDVFIVWRINSLCVMITDIWRILLINNKIQKNSFAFISPAIPPNVSKATAPEVMHENAVLYPLQVDGFSSMNVSRNWDLNFLFPKTRKANTFISYMVLIIKNAFAEFTDNGLKKSKIYAITTTNRNKYTIPLLMAANVTFGLLSITDELNSSAVAV